MVEHIWAIIGHIATACWLLGIFGVNRLLQSIADVANQNVRKVKIIYLISFLMYFVIPICLFITSTRTVGLWHTILEVLCIFVFFMGVMGVFFSMENIPIFSKTKEVGTIK